jgi:hypothetical protein
LLCGDLVDQPRWASNEESNHGPRGGDREDHAPARTGPAIAGRTTEDFELATHIDLTGAKDEQR